MSESSSESDLTSNSSSIKVDNHNLTVLNQIRRRNNSSHKNSDEFRSRSFSTSNESIEKIELEFTFSSNSDNSTHINTLLNLLNKLPATKKQSKNNKNKLASYHSINKRRNSSGLEAIIEDKNKKKRVNLVKSRKKQDISKSLTDIKMRGSQQINHQSRNNKSNDDKKRHATDDTDYVVPTANQFINLHNQQQQRDYAMYSNEEDLMRQKNKKSKSVLIRTPSQMEEINYAQQPQTVPATNGHQPRYRRGDHSKPVIIVNKTKSNNPVQGITYKPAKVVEVVSFRNNNGRKRIHSKSRSPGPANTRGDSKMRQVRDNVISVINKSLLSESRGFMNYQDFSLDDKEVRNSEHIQVNGQIQFMNYRSAILRDRYEITLPFKRSPSVYFLYDKRKSDIKKYFSNSLPIKSYSTEDICDVYMPRQLEALRRKIRSTINSVSLFNLNVLKIPRKRSKNDVDSYERITNPARYYYLPSQETNGNDRHLSSVERRESARSYTEEAKKKLQERQQLKNGSTYLNDLNNKMKSSVNNIIKATQDLNRTSELRDRFGRANSLHDLNEIEKQNIQQIHTMNSSFASEDIDNVYMPWMMENYGRKLAIEALRRRGNMDENGMPIKKFDNKNQQQQQKQKKKAAKSARFKSPYVSQYYIQETVPSRIHRHDLWAIDQDIKRKAKDAKKILGAETDESITDSDTSSDDPRPVIPDQMRNPDMSLRNQILKTVNRSLLSSDLTGINARLIKLDDKARKTLKRIEKRALDRDLDYNLIRSFSCSHLNELRKEDIRYVNTKANPSSYSTEDIDDLYMPKILESYKLKFAVNRENTYRGYDNLISSVISPGSNRGQSPDRSAHTRSNGRTPQRGASNVMSPLSPNSNNSKSANIFKQIIQEKLQDVDKEIATQLALKSKDRSLASQQDKSDTDEDQDSSMNLSDDLEMNDDDLELFENKLNQKRKLNKQAPLTPKGKILATLNRSLLYNPSELVSDFYISNMNYAMKRNIECVQMIADDLRRRRLGARHNKKMRRSLSVDHLYDVRREHIRYTNGAEDQLHPISFTTDDIQDIYMPWIVDNYRRKIAVELERRRRYNETYIPIYERQRNAYSSIFSDENFPSRVIEQTLTPIVIDKFDRILLKQANMSIERTDFPDQEVISASQQPMILSPREDRGKVTEDNFRLQQGNQTVYQEILNDTGHLTTYHPPFIRQIYLPPPSNTDFVNLEEKYKIELNKRIDEREGFSKEFIRNNRLYNDTEDEALYRRAKITYEQPEDSFNSSVLVTKHPSTLLNKFKATESHPEHIQNAEVIKSNISSTYVPIEEKKRIAELSIHNVEQDFSNVIEQTVVSVLSDRIAPEIITVEQAQVGFEKQTVTYVSVEKPPQPLNSAHSSQDSPLRSSEEIKDMSQEEPDINRANTFIEEQINRPISQSVVYSYELPKPIVSTTLPTMKIKEKIENVAPLVQHTPTTLNVISLGKETKELILIEEPNQFENVFPQEYTKTRLEPEKPFSLVTTKSQEIMENADSLKIKKAYEQTPREAIEITRVNRPLFAHDIEVVDTVELLPSSEKPAESYATSSIVEKIKKDKKPKDNVSIVNVGGDSDEFQEKIDKKGEGVAALPQERMKHYNEENLVIPIESIERMEIDEPTEIRGSFDIIKIPLMKTTQEAQYLINRPAQSIEKEYRATEFETLPTETERANLGINQLKVTDRHDTMQPIEYNAPKASPLEKFEIPTVFHTNEPRVETSRIEEIKVNLQQANVDKQSLLNRANVEQTEILDIALHLPPQEEEEDLLALFISTQNETKDKNEISRIFNENKSLENAKVLEEATLTMETANQSKPVQLHAPKEKIQKSNQAEEFEEDTIDGIVLNNQLYAAQDELLGPTKPTSIYTYHAPQEQTEESYRTDDLYDFSIDELTNKNELYTIKEELLSPTTPSSVLKYHAPQEQIELSNEAGTVEDSKIEDLINKGEVYTTAEELLPPTNKSTTLKYHAPAQHFEKSYIADDLEDSNIHGLVNKNQFYTINDDLFSPANASSILKYHAPQEQIEISNVAGNLESSNIEGLINKSEWLAINEELLPPTKQTTTLKYHAPAENVEKSFLADDLEDSIIEGLLNKSQLQAINEELLPPTKQTTTVKYHAPAENVEKSFIADNMEEFNSEEIANKNKFSTTTDDLLPPAKPSSILKYHAPQEQFENANQADDLEDSMIDGLVSKSQLYTSKDELVPPSIANKVTSLFVPTTNVIPGEYGRSTNFTNDYETHTLSLNVDTVSAAVLHLPIVEATNVNISSGEETQKFDLLHATQEFEENFASNKPLITQAILNNEEYYVTIDPKCFEMFPIQTAEEVDDEGQNESFTDDLQVKSDQQEITAAKPLQNVDDPLTYIKAISKLAINLPKSEKTEKYERTEIFKVENNLLEQLFPKTPVIEQNLFEQTEEVVIPLSLGNIVKEKVRTEIVENLEEPKQEKVKTSKEPLLEAPEFVELIINTEMSMANVNFLKTEELKSAALTTSAHETAVYNIEREQNDLFKPNENIPQQLLIAVSNDEKVKSEKVHYLNETNDNAETAKIVKEPFFDSKETYEIEESIQLVMAEMNFLENVDALINSFHTSTNELLTLNQERESSKLFDSVSNQVTPLLLGATSEEKLKTEKVQPLEDLDDQRENLKISKVTPFEATETYNTEKSQQMVMGKFDYDENCESQIHTLIIDTPTAARVIAHKEHEPNLSSAQIDQQIPLWSTISRQHEQNAESTKPMETIEVSYEEQINAIYASPVNLQKHNVESVQPIFMAEQNREIMTIEKCDLIEDDGSSELQEYGKLHAEKIQSHSETSLFNQPIKYSLANIITDESMKVEETIDLEAQHIDMTQSLTKFDYMNEVQANSRVEQEYLPLLSHSTTHNIELESVSKLSTQEFDYSKPTQLVEPNRLENESATNIPQAQQLFAHEFKTELYAEEYLVNKNNEQVDPVKANVEVVKSESNSEVGIEIVEKLSMAFIKEENEEGSRITKEIRDLSVAEENAINFLNFTINSLIPDSYSNEFNLFEHESFCMARVELNKSLSECDENESINLNDIQQSITSKLEARSSEIIPRVELNSSIIQNLPIENIFEQEKCEKLVETYDEYCAKISRESIELNKACGDEDYIQQYFAPIVNIGQEIEEFAKELKLETDNETLAKISREKINAPQVAKENSLEILNVPIESDIDKLFSGKLNNFSEMRLMEETLKINRELNMANERVRFEEVIQQLSSCVEQYIEDIYIEKLSVLVNSTYDQFEEKASIKCENRIPYQSLNKKITSLLNHPEVCHVKQETVEFKNFNEDLEELFESIQSKIQRPVLHAENHLVEIENVLSVFAHNITKIEEMSDENVKILQQLEFEMQEAIVGKERPFKLERYRVESPPIMLRTATTKLDCLFEEFSKAFSTQEEANNAKASKVLPENLSLASIQEILKLQMPVENIFKEIRDNNELRALRQDFDFEEFGFPTYESQNKNLSKILVNKVPAKLARGLEIEEKIKDLQAGVLNSLELCEKYAQVLIADKFRFEYVKLNIMQMLACALVLDEIFFEQKLNPINEVANDFVQKQYESMSQTPATTSSIEFDSEGMNDEKCNDFFDTENLESDVRSGKANLLAYGICSQKDNFDWEVEQELVEDENDEFNREKQFAHQKYEIDQLFNLILQLEHVPCEEVSELTSEVKESDRRATIKIHANEFPEIYGLNMKVLNVSQMRTYDRLNFFSPNISIKPFESMSHTNNSIRESFRIDTTNSTYTSLLSTTSNNNNNNNNRRSDLLIQETEYLVKRYI